MAATEGDTLYRSYAFGESPLTTGSLSKPMKTYLFGYPIAHSFSPTLHDTIYTSLGIPWNYDLVESIDKSEFLPKLKADNCIGSAVTMPHKVAFTSEVDDLTEEGRMIGAINTVFIRLDEKGNKRYIGTNTDCIGIRESFYQNYPDILKTSVGKPALVQGGGGACRSAVYTLHKWLGASKIYLVNRLESEVAAMVEEFAERGFGGELVHVKTLEIAKALEAPTVIVSTVPNFPPKEKGEVLARAIVTEFLKRKEKGHVLEMCYHPNPITEFYKLAQDNGWEVILGTEPMIHQGIAQDILWTEKPAADFPTEKVHAAIANRLNNHDH
jgi:quinate dehydrogenase